MADIALYQRGELPPGRAGLAKPPYELADRSGQIQFGEALTQFSGTIWEQLIRSQAANEEAEARGQVETFIETFETFVADRPNASAEELQKEWGKISTQIKAIPGTLKTGIAKRNFGNFLALNEGVINQRVQTSIEGIRNKQELARYNATRGALIAKGTLGARNELVKLNAEQVEAGLLNPETVEIQQALDFAEMDRQAVFRLINEGNFGGAQAAVYASQFLSEKEKTSLYTRVRQVRSATTNKAKTMVQAYKEAALEDIVGKLAQDPDSISPLDIDQLRVDDETKDMLISIVANRIDALDKGRPDPLTEFDPYMVSAMHNSLNEDPKSRTVEEIVAAVGKGLSAVDAVELLAKRRGLPDKTNPLNRPIVKRVISDFTTVGKAGFWSDDELENIMKENAIKTEFEAWVIRDNPTDKEILEKERQYLAVKASDGLLEKLMDFPWWRWTTFGAAWTLGEKLKGKKKLRDNQKREIVSFYLEQTNGDIDEAKRMAAEDGYDIE